MKGKPQNNTIRHVQEQACTRAHVSVHISACAKSRIDNSITKYADTSESGLRWPTSAVLGSSANLAKNGPTLTETKARLA